MTKILIPDSKIEAIKQQAALVQKESAGLTVTSMEACQAAAHFLTKVIAETRPIEEMEAIFVKPQELALKDAKNRLKTLAEPYEAVADQVRDAMNKYLKEYYEEFKRLAAESKEPLEWPEFSVQTENGLVFVKEIAEVEVEDISKVPAKYLTMAVDMKLVKEALSHGVERIPGIKIGKKPNISVRQ